MEMDKLMEMAQAHGLSVEDVQTVAAYSVNKIADNPPKARKRPREDDLADSAVIAPEVKTQWIMWHDQAIIFS